MVITATPGAGEVDGIPVRRIDAPRAPHFGFLVTRAGVRAVGRAIADEHVDVAHCHVSIVSPTAFGGALEAHERSIPTVVTFHSTVPQMRLLARSVNAAFGASRRAVCYSAVSERVARDVAPIAGTRSITILPNGIDAAFWRVDAPPPRNDTLRLISVMRLNPKKRPLALVDVVRRASALLPNRRVHLRIIGDGPQRERLERAISANGLSDRITLVGRQSRDEIKRHLAESDLFVLPTVRESFGLAALEARCAGLPVLAMRASGVSELIADGREGLLARSDAELAEHVAALGRDEPRRAAIAEHNRRTTPVVDWPAVVDAHLALYRDAIALRDTVCTDIIR